VESDFAEPEAACARHDRAAYEAELNELLLEREQAPEQRLERALERRLAAAWLMTNVAARCKF
jgi:predicted subunit of tRNA(5-methylaminomethyl-2-thiouridylate) methyltransferase